MYTYGASTCSSASYSKLIRTTERVTRTYYSHSCWTDVQLSWWVLDLVRILTVSLFNHVFCVALRTSSFHFRLVFITKTGYVYCAVRTECNSDISTSCCADIVGWGGSGWIDLPCPLQSVCQRHVLTLAPLRVSPLRGWHGHHSHVPQADAARQLPGVIPQRPSTVVERMENRH